MFEEQLECLPAARGAEHEKDTWESRFSGSKRVPSQSQMPRLGFFPREIKTCAHKGMHVEPRREKPQKSTSR